MLGTPKCGMGRGSVAAGMAGDFKMKGLMMNKNVVFVVAGFAGVVAVGAALAGSPPAANAPVATGCHGRPMMAPAPLDCHGYQMLAPAVTAAGGCHGGNRLTFAERRMARSAARSNYRTTLDQFRSAGRMGNLSAVPTAQTAYQMVPVAPAAVAPPTCNCPADCKCKTAP